MRQVSLAVFFLYKQKTADEMRISDWSSDVCSSDLQADRARRARECGAAGRKQHPDADPDLVVPDAAADRRLDLLHAPDAVRRRQGDGLRQVQGPADRKSVV